MDYGRNDYRELDQILGNEPESLQQWKIRAFNAGMYFFGALLLSGNLIASLTLGLVVTAAAAMSYGWATVQSVGVVIVTLGILKWAGVIAPVMF